MTEQEFVAIVREHQERLYIHIRGMVGRHEDADDVLQNTFLKAWQARDSFRGDAKIGSWLFRIATNEALNFIEKNKITSDGEMPDVASDPYFDGDETERQLQRAVTALPPKQKQVFLMKYFQDMKYEEMSEILGTSVGSLKASYHMAVEKIQNFFYHEE